MITSIPIIEPTMVLDEQICKQNIARMATKAAALGVTLRPHFKTHQSPEIGEWFREVNVTGITVSSFAMADFFALCDWHDILVAFPVNVLEHERINRLASCLKLHVLVANAEGAKSLSERLEHPVEVFIKIDSGYHRAGIEPHNTEEIDEILRIIDRNKLMSFEGFLTHAGHTYAARGKEEVLQIHRKSLQIMSDLRDKYIGKYPHLTISIGDTPSCSLTDDFGITDEIRPGNFVFYDAMQLQIGSCRLEDIALTVECPVVDIHRERNQVVIYGGGVHFSKDRIPNVHGEAIYGIVIENTDEKQRRIMAGVDFISVSQEHGILRFQENIPANLHVGDVVTIVPVHSCMTADTLQKYFLHNGSIFHHI